MTGGMRRTNCATPTLRAASERCREAPGRAAPTHTAHATRSGLAQGGSRVFEVIVVEVVVKVVVIEPPIRVLAVEVQ